MAIYCANPKIKVNRYYTERSESILLPTFKLKVVAGISRTYFDMNEKCGVCGNKQH